VIGWPIVKIAREQNQSSIAFDDVLILIPASEEMVSETVGRKSKERPERNYELPR